MRKQFLAFWLLPTLAGSVGLLEQGILERDQGRFEESILSFQSLLKAEPDSARIWFELGLSYAKDAQYPKAIDAYRLAISHKLPDALCHCALSLALRETGKQEAALTEANRCHELRPKYAGAWNLIGNIEIDQGHLSRALEAYQNAVKLKPAYANARFNLGLALEALGRHSEAETEFLEAIRLEATMKLVWTALGDCQISQSRARDALKSYEQALKLSPQETQAQWGLARAWRKLGNKKKAAIHERAYKRLLREADKRSRSLRSDKDRRAMSRAQEAWDDKDLRERN